MSEDEQSSPDGGTEGVADRVELRRIQLGLSPSELAHRARMSTSYLRELASLRGDFDPEGLTRLAEALGMTSDELLHGRADPPPGQTNSRRPPASDAPHGARVLGPARNTRGRAPGSPGDTAPVIVPVNFLVDGRSVVYRTRPGSVGAVGAGTPLAFEADRLDEERMRGWSVLLTGTAEHITDPTTTGPLADRAGARPWAGGSRPLWIRVLPEEITGRVIDIP